MKQHTDSERSQERGRLHLILGPTGAGKSTFARELARTQQAVSMNLDQWMITLFRPDRPDDDVMGWYRERSERCVEQIWYTSLQIMRANTSVILELGLVQRWIRSPFLQRLDASGVDATLYVIDAPREVRRARVEQRNKEKGSTFLMTMSPHLFEVASDYWEPLDEEECAGRKVQFISTAP